MGCAAHVWLADTANLGAARLEDYAAWLSASERQRTFARPARRVQFVAARALLRIAAGTLLDLPPQAVAFGGAPGRAPWLLEPAVALPGVSVSHSGTWVACALSADTALGLDIELRDPARDIDALAAHAFDAATCAHLDALPPDARRAAFYDAWSAQEARIKLGMEAGGCVTLPHEALAMVLCSGAPLAAPPALRVAAL